MPTLLFIGQVLPGHFEVTTAPFDCKWGDTGDGLDVLLNIKIESSVITVRCTADRFEDPSYTQLLLKVLDLTRGMVDLFGFASGIPFSINFHTCIQPDWTRSNIVIAYYDMARICTAINITSLDPADRQTLHQTMQLVLADGGLTRALRDLMEAVSVPHRAIINCGRVIDSLRHLTTNGMPANDSWRVFRSTLNISKDYIKLITDASTGPRHGAPPFLPKDKIDLIVERTCIVMNRFLEFKKLGSTPLPESEFPILV